MDEETESRERERRWVLNFVWEWKIVLLVGEDLIMRAQF